MVISWILNTISKDIAEAFIYATSAKDLWDELQKCFGQTNGPLIFQLKREISSFIQGNRFVMVYFTKLKKIWDELSCLRPFSACDCGASKVIISLDSDDKLM